jgi:hypothetical protein
MNFGNPAFLYALPVVLVPIIIHFLKLYRTTTFYYSRVEDIKRLKKDQKKVKQLKDWLTLLLRTLAVLFLVLAFAKPSFNETKSNGYDKHQKLHFVIDNSPSNSFGNQKGLSDYKTAVINTLENLPENQSISLSVANNFWENELINDAIKKVSNLEVANKPFKLSTISDSLSKKYIYSDFQSLEWSQFDATNVLFNAPKHPLSNIAIDTAYTIENQLNYNEKSLVVQYSKSGESDDKVAFELLLNNESLINKILDFGKENTLFDTLKIKADTSNFSSLDIRIEDQKGLSFDNEYFVSLAPKNKTKVVVYGKELNNPVFEKLLDRDGDYAYQYLRQGHDNFSNINYGNVLVIAGINTIDANLKSELLRLKQNGGTCLFFPGPKIDASVNKFLSEYQIALQKSEVVESQLQAFNFNHPYFQNVFSQIPNSPSLPIVSETYTITGAPSYTELIKGIYGSLAVELKKREFNLVVSGIPYRGNNLKNTFFQHALFVPFAHKALELYRSNNSSLKVIDTRLYSNVPQNGFASIKNNGKLVTELPWQKKFGKSYLNLGDISLASGFYTITTELETILFVINAPRSESSLLFVSDEELEQRGFKKIDDSSTGAMNSLLDFEENDGYLFFALVFICLLLESLINKFLSHESKAIRRS